MKPPSTGLLNGHTRNFSLMVGYQAKVNSTMASAMANGNFATRAVA